VRALKKETLFRDILRLPLRLHLEPSYFIYDEFDQNHPSRGEVAIYVEPPRATGLREVIGKLRRAVKASAPLDREEDAYTQLNGNGLRAGRRTQSISEDVRLPEERQPQFGADVRYRMVVTDNLNPIGYCTFFLQISKWQDIEVELDEVWLARDYRGLGIGYFMADKVAEITTLTIRELDQRARDHRTSRLTLALAVGGDVYSHTGESFVRCVYRSLRSEVELIDWNVINFSGFFYAARW
jgi:GNAT superfamily N-acetyltransferase